MLWGAPSMKFRGSKMLFFGHKFGPLGPNINLWFQRIVRHPASQLSMEFND